MPANPSPISVAKRAQHCLTHELSFTNPIEFVSELIITTFLASYKQPLSNKAIATIYSIVCLNKKKKAKATVGSSVTKEDEA